MLVGFNVEENEENVKVYIHYTTAVPSTTTQPTSQLSGKHHINNIYVTCVNNIYEMEDDGNVEIIAEIAHRHFNFINSISIFMY
jgi:hypothetical protein